MHFLPRSTCQSLWAALILWLLPLACTPVGALQGASRNGTDKTYEVVYTLKLRSGEDRAYASIRVGQGARRLRQLRFHFDPDRYSDFNGGGNLDVDNNEVIWRPPGSGGTLEFRVKIPHRRSNGAYDALVTDHWALFRGGDVFPPASTRVLAGSKSESRLELELPKGWSAITPYLSGEDKLTFPIDNPARSFDRPTGWILAGNIGVRRGKIANTRVAIASPVGQGMRRMDIMAFLRWTLPGVVAVFPTMDARLIIVGANDPMWRGGLSGPGSLYVHSDRPLISENGTSTFLHELVHVAMGVAGSGHDDWLLEGLAEYYSIKILHTSGTLSRRRMELALAELESWGKDVDNLFVRHSSGKITARATTQLAALDALLTERSPDGLGIDAVVEKMIENGRTYNYGALCKAARDVMRGPVPVLDPSQVPGAPDLPECRDAG